RAGKVQLIDANNVYRKLRKNLGNKNSEFSPEQIAHIAQAYLENWDHNPTDSELKVKIFNNADFGYYKVNIERPKRLKAQFSKEALDTLRFDKGLQIPMQALYDAALQLWQHIGDDIFMDFNAFSTLVDEVVKQHKLSLSAAEKKAILQAISSYDAEAEKVIKKVE